MDVNALEAFSDDWTDDSEDWSEWNDDAVSVATDISEASTVSHESDASEKSVVDYPYDYDALRKSQPMQGPIVINGECIPAVFDSGAGVSVIGLPLAEKLGEISTGTYVHFQV
ncbi:hypothetical protein BCR43DRAFT_503475 [Syncephalastrum racemosum]|uniref:Uncharacterized protein n=1 Tax=Syncephalastrum racemosum TaxID=13706 RepID=A0A1X2HHW2_SYNRA|nr:hypothetical protein BCR43DRAFT_503475 [Syncephalastrum racemosum]